MGEKKTRSKKARPKSDTLGKEILAALAEFTEALESGEVAAHLQKRRAKVGEIAVTHLKLGLRKKPRTPKVGGGKEARD